MRTRALLFLIAAWPALAQNTPSGDMMPIRFPLYPQLTKYLDLKADQLLALAQVKIEWQAYLAAKTRRVAQVESEISQITHADMVDAPALGVRYAELEAICREARETDSSLQKKARKTLTDAQRTKLAVLEQAYALLPVIGEADDALLLDAPLPGLQMAGVVSAMAARGYPGCRPVQPADSIIPMPDMPGPQ